MSEYLKNLRANRARLQDRGTAIIDAAERAGRNDLNDSEQREFDEVTENLRSTDDTLARLEERESNERETESAFARLMGQPEVGTESSSSSAARSWLPVSANIASCRASGVPSAHLVRSSRWKSRRPTSTCCGSGPRSSPLARS